MKQTTNTDGDRYITNIIQFPSQPTMDNPRQTDLFEIVYTPITPKFLMEFCEHFEIDYIEEFMHIFEKHS